MKVKDLLKLLEKFNKESNVKFNVEGNESYQINDAFVIKNEGFDYDTVYLIN